MIEYTYLGSGYWAAECTLCRQYIQTQSLAEAHKRAHAHQKTCGQ